MPSPKHPLRKPIQRHHVEPMIRALTRKGQIFGVKFYKKDGSPRTMCCRLAVSKGVTGKGKRWDRTDYANLMTVYDLSKHKDGIHKGEVKGFRNVNIDTVQSFTARGQQFDVY